MKANLTSNLFRAIQNRAVASQDHSFRKGQVVAGNITKLYPNQQAVVKIAGQEMVAQLQASLTTGKSYWFQVDSTEPNMKLKVVTEKNAARQNLDARQLLVHMGLKPTRDRQAILQSLMESGAPLQKKQLIKVMLLTDQIGRKNLDMQAVQEIIRRDLPVTNAVYQAFTSRNSQALTQQLGEVLAEMKSLDSGSPSHNQLVRRLQQLLLHPFVPEAGEKTPDKEILLQTLKGEVIKLNDSENAVNFRTSGQMFSVSPAGESARIVKEQLPVDVPSKKKFIQLSDLLIKMQTTSLSKEENNRLYHLIQDLTKKGVLEKVSAYTGLPIAKEMDTIVRSGGNPPEVLIRSIAQVAAAQLTRGSEAVLYEQVQKLESAKHALNDPHSFFLAKLKNYQVTMGLNYEAQALTKLTETEGSINEESLKSLLLQMSQDGSIHGKTAKLEMLIQTLTGIQLSSIQESEEFLQISMQLPGDSIGIKEDAFLDLESKKNPNGEIDPSFCRILIYLQLERLEETILDMNVADRAVSLTIYNGKGQKDVFEGLRPVLEAGLQQLDYKLTALKVKDVSEAGANQMAVQPHSSPSSFKGVDFRI